MDFNFDLGISSEAQIDDDGVRNNVMHGQGNILSVRTKDIDCESDLRIFSPIECTMDLISNSDNKMTGKVNVIDIPTSKYVSNDIFDVYLYNKIPLMNFDNASLLSGKPGDDKSFKSYMRLNNVQKIDKKVIKNMLTANMFFYSMQDNDQPFKVYLLNKKLDDQITCENKPSKGKFIGEATTEDGRLYKIDITDYIKDLYNRKIPNNGFVFENDNYIQLFSSDSNANKPELVIDWVDPNVYINETHIDNEVDLLLASSLVCEVDFNDEFPRLDCEAMVTIDTIENEADLRKQSYLENECTLGFPSETTTIDCEMDLSNISPTRICETELRFTNSTECELNLDVLNKSDLDNEANILLVNSITNEVTLGEETHVDCECTLFQKEHENLDCEVTLSKPSINCEMDLYPITSLECEANLDLIAKSSIENEVCLYKQNIKNTIHSQADILLVNTLDCEMVLSENESSYIECETDVKFVRQENMDNELTLIFPEMSTIDTEMDLRFGSHIDNELGLLIPEQSHIDNELTLIFPGMSTTETEIDLRFGSHIDNEMILSIPEQSHIENEINLMLVGKSELETEMDLRLQNYIDNELGLLIPEQSHNDCEAIIMVYGNSSLDSEMTLANAEQIEGNITIRKKDSIEAEADLLLSNPLDCEVNLLLSSSVDCEVNILNQSYLDNEINVMFEKDIECEADLLLTSAVECELLFLNENESVQDCEMELKFIKETTLDCECEVISQNQAIIRIIEV